MWPPSVERRKCRDPISLGLKLYAEEAGEEAGEEAALPVRAGAQALTFRFSAKTRSTVAAGIITGCRKHGYLVEGTNRRETPPALLAAVVSCDSKSSTTHSIVKKREKMKRC